MTTSTRPNPDLKFLRVVACDLNGQARGKSMRIADLEKVKRDGARMPLSALNLDMNGEDIDGSPLVFSSGDQDGVLKPTGRGLVPMPWLDNPTALLPVWMFREDGDPFLGDPRQVLASVLADYATLGWSPQIATEFEFYLLKSRNAPPQPAPSPLTGNAPSSGDILSSRALDDFDGFLAELFDAAEQMGIPAQTATSEGGIGQFEVTLRHDHALKAADDAWLFKMLTKGLAAKHGFAASFMAKPFADQPGNGLHLHCSVLDETGANIFDDGTESGSETLTAAVAGCLDALTACTAIFAPNVTSYDRFVADSHAPTKIAWGYENRTVALRVPAGAPDARRIEHRLAGGDTNPYLYFAAVLAAMHDGITRKLTPPSAVSGNAYTQDLPEIPLDLETAIRKFSTEQTIKNLLPRALIENFVAMKQQEIRVCADLSRAEIQARYLDTH